MLRELFIKNYLLIDEIKLDFDAGFSVITGETGAGKSIILGAISLLLGKRADTDVLLDKSEKCIVEGSFDLSNQALKDVFNNADLDYDKHTIIRREILPEGKSRAFVNDTPVNLTVLKTISEKITNLHSQHENLALSVAEYRMQIIDTTAGTTGKLLEYQAKFEELKNNIKHLEGAKQEFAKAKQEIDYYQFQIDQLINANLDDENELNELEGQALMLENAEEIKAVLTNSMNLIDNNEFSIDALLSELKNSIAKISGSYKNAKEIAERIDAIVIELRDINEQIAGDGEKAEINPSLLNKVNQRIDLLNSLLTKHNAIDIAELKQKLNEYRKFINSTEEIEQNIINLEAKVKHLTAICLEKAQNLSKQRIAIFEKTEKFIEEQLKQLGMPHAIFKVHNTILETFSANGIDNINFLFSANKSVKPQTLDKVASGGEFSRLMLTLKSLLIKASGVSCIIFDEIDTGVSGEIASKMGKIMQNIASDAQVISITHLPQVAALGKNHFKVYKQVIEDKTSTHILKLTSEDRVNEIASMISGEKMTVQAIENAKILLEN
ncbi:MAG: DNA repair protein RecN [Bacteroidales bacterium]|nr:DNA repair protein RecN [Bacteroidales bacterium]MDD4215776.1 DNA repair protein RecN [Bacteroidales bacterium]MDY0140383.1 DNA repair protein RecN [Bacteroidales bacterium]